MDMEKVASHPRVTAALSYLDATDGMVLDDMVELTSIAAPGGSERARGEWLTARLRALGLDVAAPDDAGNIRAVRAGRDPAALPVFLVSHLDTVFDADTDLAVTRHHGRIHAPGISDNSRGVAALVAIARTLRETQIVTRAPLVFIGSVGEEGAGDLRGVKHLLSHDVACAAFLAVDGAGLNRIVHRAVGSRRFRVTVRGPGGHSWVDRGTAHPVHTLAAAIAHATESARYPRSSFSVGRMEGGTGINVIPVDAIAEIDIRSEDGDEIARVEAALRDALSHAITAANDRRKEGTAPLTHEITLIGDRPGGSTPADAAVVRLAWEATRVVGATPELTSSSTDANVPMSLGIPAIAIGAGGDAGGMHTTDEWYSNENGPAGLKRLLLLVLALSNAVLDGDAALDGDAVLNGDAVLHT
jgi:acetylornithine deacetylase/succinyl-diaminopimelate desuccinylase-like protein